MSVITSLKQPVSLRKRSNVINLNVSLGNYQHVRDWIINAAQRGDSRTVCFANVHMAVECRQKPDVARAVNNADWVTPDGMPLVWAMRLLYGIQQDRITGMDMLPSLLEQAAEHKIPVFFYGSTADVLERSEKACQQLFPRLIIAGAYSPPFRKLTEEEEEEEINLITKSGAKLVFVALGCPKQELWLSRMRNRIPAVLLAIGGALPVLAGEVSRAPLWMQRAGMEWIFRLVQEPRRLFKRYAVTNSVFVYSLIRQKLSLFLFQDINLKYYYQDVDLNSYLEETGQLYKVENS
ncbi:WecB/TagA/CpsF family glycosyltransferase [Spirosoma soli]|uniref:WecB/TagA/CpsF family glycosyltransferase n=1 Tax=Spirosoma soli TaxID=1770529 RepID=A0ABW5M394_9BACT